MKRLNQPKRLQNRTQMWTSWHGIEKNFIKLLEIVEYMLVLTENPWLMNITANTDIFSVSIRATTSSTYMVCVCECVHKQQYFHSTPQKITIE